MSTSVSRRQSQSRSFLPPIHSHSSSANSTPRRQQEEARLLKLLDEYDEKQQSPPQPDGADDEAVHPPTTNHLDSDSDDAVTAVDAYIADGESEDAALPHIASHLSSHLACPYGSFQSQQAIQWLWYVAQHAGEHDEAAVEAVFSASDTMAAVSEWIDVALRTSKGSVDKQKRNNLVALLAHITQRPNAQAECAINGLLETLLTHATADTAIHAAQQSRTAHEEKQQLLPAHAADASGSPSRWTSTTDAADLELRQLLWCVLAALSSHWLCHAAVRQSPLLSTLLHYVDAGCGGRHWLCQRWQPSELLQLQHYALLTLLTVAPAMPELFERLDGAERLVCLVANITASEAAQVDGKRSAAQRRQLQALAVKCLADVFAAAHASPAHPEVEALLSSEPADAEPAVRPSLPATVAPLLSLVADGGLSLSCRCDALNALVNLCAERREHRHALCRQRGVELVAAMLADEAALTAYVSQHPQLVAALVGCVWRCVVPSDSCAAAFLAADGLESLLVLVTRTAAQPALQQQALSCLADLLLLHGDARPRFRAWSHRVHAPSLLPAQPHSVAAHLATHASAPLPTLSALDLILTLWPTADGEQSLRLRRVLYAVLDGVGFDTFAAASAAQRGQLAWIAAFPCQCELRVWSELVDDMARSGQWDELVEEDRQRALGVRAALEAQLLAAERYGDAMAREQLCAAEHELASYLAVLNEQRVDLTRRMLATPHFAAHSLRSQALSPRSSRQAAQQPSGSALLSTLQRSALGAQQPHNPHRHNNSLYGRYKQVGVTPAQQPHIAQPVANPLPPQASE